MAPAARARSIARSMSASAPVMSPRKNRPIPTSASPSDSATGSPIASRTSSERWALAHSA